MATFSINAVDSRVQYTGDGTTTDFAFTFQVNSSSELAIYSDDTLKTITTHYTVSLNSDGSLIASANPQLHKQVIEILKIN